MTIHASLSTKGAAYVNSGMVELDIGYYGKIFHFPFRFSADSNYFL